MKLYKIQHRKTKLFSKGGIFSNDVENDGVFSMKWSSNGKTWDSIGKLRSHLTSNISHFGPPVDMSEWEIIEFTASETKRGRPAEFISAGTLVKLLRR